MMAGAVVMDLADVNLDGAAGLLLYVLADGIDLFPQGEIQVIFIGAEGAADLGILRYGTAYGAAVELTELQQPENSGRNLPLHLHGPGIKFRTGHKGIHTLCRFCDMGRLAINIQCHLTGSGHQLISAAEYFPLFQCRPQVKTENRLYPVKGIAFIERAEANSISRSSA